MKTIETLKATGKLRLVLDKENGDQEVHQFDNLVVTTGKNFIASRMVGTSDNVMSHIGIGSGSTAAAAGDSALGSSLARVAVTGTPGASGAVATYTATFAAGTGTGAVTEAGLFNASSSGTMLCRTVFAAVNKASGDSMTITWTVTIS